MQCVCLGYTYQDLSPGILYFAYADFAVAMSSNLILIYSIMFTMNVIDMTVQLTTVRSVACFFYI